MFRPITKEEAEKARDILAEECGFREVSFGPSPFVHHIPCAADEHYPCREYRFGGALGFGGKFRNNGNRNNTPHVDCYPEDETPDRLEMIRRANERLAELFAAEPEPSRPINDLSDDREALASAGIEEGE